MPVAGTVGLRRDATRAHADEGAVPIDEVKNRHTHSQRSDRCDRVAQVSRYHRADDTHDGYGDVGDDVGQSYA